MDDDYEAMAETFEELISRHLDGLYSAALCFVGDEHRAEELLQEAAVRGFHEFAVDADAESFRERMLGRLVQAYLRRERRRGRDPLSEDGFEVGEEVDGEARPSGRMPSRGSAGYQEFERWLERVLGELDDGDRLILWLTDVEGLGHGKVAEMVGSSEEGVRARHYRARRTLSIWARTELERWSASGPRS